MLLREPSDRAVVVERESRAHAVTDLELRATDDGKVTFDGIASVVDTPYSVRDFLGEYTETMSRGAFSKTLKEKADVRLLVNHEGVPLARTKSKTLTLTASPDLRAVAGLDPANPTVQEIRSAMDRGDLDQMSIGFRVTRQEWNGDYTERTIKEVELHDVSVVTYPASTTTSAQLRSFDEFLAALDSAELDPDDLLRAWAKLGERITDDYVDALRQLTAVDFSDRDRADAERLERHRLLRPVVAV
jgi:HK97 family phage prohead protease